MNLIQFFCEDIKFSISQKLALRNWIKSVINLESGALEGLNYIFCSDAYLQKLNKKFLDHDCLTDILTFNQSESESIQGEIFISLDRVRENSKLYQCSFEEELHRVIIHGALHLIGYKDRTRKEKELMREKEEAYLSLLSNKSST